MNHTGHSLLITDSYGIYVPQMFAEMVKDFLHKWEGIDSEDIKNLLSGPDSDDYWDTWDHVLQNAYLLDEENKMWMIHQDGDLHMYCDELMNDEEYFNFWGENRYD